jgi:hypothetical protein
MCEQETRSGLEVILWLTQGMLARISSKAAK